MPANLLAGASSRNYAQNMQSFPGYDRITTDPGMLGGKPCIRGMRLSVQRVLEVLAQQPSAENLKRNYPDLEDEDIRQALAFASSLLADRIIPLDLSAA